MRCASAPTIRHQFVSIPSIVHQPSFLQKFPPFATAVALVLSRSLLRAHTPTEKKIVRTAIDVLIPALPRRLTKDELEIAMKYTTKIVYEEGNSMPQLAHLWEIITRHPQVYTGQKNELIPQ